MKYSRKELKEISGRRDFDESQKVNEDFHQRFKNGDKFTLAEEEWLGNLLSILRVGEGMGTPAYEVDKIEICQNYWFRDRYLTYANDLNGHKRVFHAIRELSGWEKERDVDYLEQQYQSWKTQILNSVGKQTNNPLWNHIVSETNYQFGELEKYCQLTTITGFYKDYLIKSLFLHSKFIYLTVQEFYEEKGGKPREHLSIFGQDILIDSYGYIHTLFRHYSEFIKFYQGSGKSYHFDQQIYHKELPDFFKTIVDAFGKVATAGDFDKGRPDKCINFVYDGTEYTIWFKPFKESVSKGVNITFNRLQTFYPVSTSDDKKRISVLKPLPVDSRLVFLI